jgi:predicted transcriptional regulator
VNIAEIIKLTEATVVAGNPDIQTDIERAFSSDLMSDVLTLDDHHIVLITGLANVQLIRTVEMADIPVVLLARNKKADEEMIKLAEENGILLLGTPYSIFRASGVLYENGLKPLY